VARRVIEVDILSTQGMTSTLGVTRCVVCVCVWSVGFRQQNSSSVNLAVNCAVANGLCDQMCQPGDPEAGTLDRCLCRAGFTLDSSGHKCLGQY